MNLERFLHFHQFLGATELGGEVVILEQFLVRRLEQAVAAKKKKKLVTGRKRPRTESLEKGKSHPAGVSARIKRDIVKVNNPYNTPAKLCGC